MTREQAQLQLEKYQKYLNRYKNYPGSPNDDALIGIYGYTVREERSYIKAQIRSLKNFLQSEGEQL